jgi:hypothetical protein
MNPTISTTATTFVILFCAIAPAHAQQAQRTYPPGEGPTDRFMQVLGLFAQTAPAIVEGKSIVKVAKIQARSADYATRGNIGIAEMGTAGQVRVARIGASATRYVADSDRRGNIATALVNADAVRYTADVNASETAAGRAARVQEAESTNGYRQQLLSRGVAVPTGE